MEGHAGRVRLFHPIKSSNVRSAFLKCRNFREAFEFNGKGRIQWVWPFSCLTCRRQLVTKVRPASPVLLPAKADETYDGGTSWTCNRTCAVINKSVCPCHEGEADGRSARPTSCAPFQHVGGTGQWERKPGTARPQLVSLSGQSRP